MQVLSLDIQNILSIERANISFEDSGLVLVEGWNYDVQRANGAGKTAIFNCLSFALYDKMPRKITASEILKRGSKTGSVKCSVKCGEEIWTVVRSRPKGVEFFKDGLKVEITQTEFEQKLKLSYQQFLLTVYTPQSNIKDFSRFLSTPDSSKKEFLLQLLNLDRFSLYKKAADDKVKELQQIIDTMSNQLNGFNSKISAYEESIEDVSDLQDRIDKLSFDINLLENEILELNLIEKPDLSKFLKLEEDAKDKLNNIVRAKVKKTMLHDQYRELSSHIHPYDPDKACSECGHSLDSEDARSAHEASQDKIKQKLIELKQSIDELDAICIKESAINDLLSKVKDKKNKESELYQDAKLKITELKPLVSSKKLQIEGLKTKYQQNSNLLEKIADLKSKTVDLESNINRNQDSINIYKTLSQFYSPTGAQAYVLDSIVDSFNERIQSYIDLLSPDVSYVLNSFKENAKGDVVAKFSETLTKNGEVISVGSLSGGEEKGLSLCIDFALLEVLETQFGMKLNPIILDEPFDGLDNAGRELVIEILETLSRDRQIFIIDHSSEAKALFTKVVRVELKNNTSSIKLEM